MGEKRQSIIFRFSKRIKDEMAIKAAYTVFRAECGFEPTLSEKYYFMSYCAEVIDCIGFIPPLYPAQSAAGLKRFRDGEVPAGWPTAKAAEAH